jgi:D-glycero-D-manno-heptose 1,7-bisphosphate phosphatase
MGIDLRRAVFLDRDGVINPLLFYQDTNAHESPRTPQEFTLLPNVPEALLNLQKAGFLLFIVSNQPNHAKGKSSMEALKAIHEKMEKTLRDAGITLSESFYCYHHPDGVTPGYGGPCRCRKPSPYFLLQAQQKYHLDMAQSWMVGDRDTDMECGHAAEVKTIFIGDNKRGHDFAAPSLHDAASIIVR